MFEEKLAYQLDERMRDMNEMVDSCHNRVSGCLTEYPAVVGLGICLRVLMHLSDRT